LLNEGAAGRIKALHMNKNCSVQTNTLMVIINRDTTCQYHDVLWRRRRRRRNKRKKNSEEVLMLTSMKMALFWDTVQCSLVHMN
jgi:hypothetical protein